MNKEYRIPVIAGNWKMNMLRKDAAVLAAALAEMEFGVDCEVVACVPYTDLDCVAAALDGSRIGVGAQNCHWAEKGAFTGEISAQMLAEIGVKYVILGHSERRQYFGETDETVNARLKAALDAKLTAIVCVGESLEEREEERTFEVIGKQLSGALDGITEQQLFDVIIAYEPVWAIGTGKTATAEQAQEVCSFIRGIVEGFYGEKAASMLRIQYGGSMNAKNAAELLGQPDIDGGLIGGASLKSPDFYEIVKAAAAE